MKLETLALFLVVVIVLCYVWYKSSRDNETW